MVFQRSSQCCWDEGQALQIVAAQAPMIHIPGGFQQQTRWGREMMDQTRFSMTYTSNTNTCSCGAPAENCSETWPRHGTKKEGIEQQIDRAFALSSPKFDGNALEMVLSIVEG